MNRSLPRWLAPAALLLSLPAIAQEHSGVLVVNTEYTQQNGIDVPQPPKALLRHSAPPPQRVLLPDGGPGLPQPVVPPIQLDAAGPLAGGDLVSLLLMPNSAGGSSRADSALEPTAACPDNMDTFFATGNWYASYKDGTNPWVQINPYTYFPSAAGGFCCDQVTTARNNATFWYLQYSATATGGAARVACSPNIAALRAGSFPFSWVFTAQQFGFAAGAWLDYPDMATTNTKLFCTSNVFSAGGSFLGSVFWRLDLAQMIAGQPTLTIHFGTSTTNGGWRLSHGAQDTMYLASHTSTSQLRVHKWPDSATVHTALGDKNVAGWSLPTGLGNPGPDNVPWSGSADSRVTGGYFAPARFRATARYGFYWTSNPVGSYTKLHARGAVFDASNDTLVEQPVIWNPNYGTAYPIAGANGLGHRGVAFAFGGGSSYPSTAFQLEDDLPLASRTFAAGAAGPSGNRWGDYMSVQSGGGYATNPQFLCSGIYRTAATGGSTPMVARLARQAFDEVAMGISVLAYPNSVDAGVSMAPLDRFGQGGTITPFYRAVDYSTGNYVFTANQQALDPGTQQRYAFVRWHRKFTGQSHTAQPLGQTTITVTAGANTHPTELVAEYTPLWDITVDANEPSDFAITPADFNGRTTSGAPRVVQFAQGSSFTLTATRATGGGGGPFGYWILDNVPQAPGVTTLTINNVSGPHHAQLYYRQFQAGSWSVFGQGCIGLIGRVQHNLSTAAAGGVQINQAINYNMNFGRPNSLALLMLGVSNTTWNGIPLPLSLTGAGAPNCTLYHDPLFFFASVSNGTGDAVQALTWPNDWTLVGSTSYSSYLCVDAFANTLGMTFSNGARLTLGGRL